MILLPFETSVFVTSRTKEKTKEILLHDVDQTKLPDSNKRFRAKIKNQSVHLWTNSGTIYKTQHYYCKFIESQKNDLAVSVFSRNNAFMILLYILFVGSGLVALVMSCLQKSFPGIAVAIAFVLFVFVMTNLLQKLERKNGVSYIKEKITGES